MLDVVCVQSITRGFPLGGACPRPAVKEGTQVTTAVIQGGTGTGQFFFCNGRNVESILQLSHKHDRMLCCDPVTLSLKAAAQVSHDQHQNAPGCRRGESIKILYLSKSTMVKVKVLIQLLYSNKS